jgi:predicted AAA+ superfamily ATPase
MLSKELSTSLRGRTAAREIFPLNFSEYLRFYNTALVVKSSRQKSQVAHLFESYLNNGGFPEVVNLSERERVDVLQEYINLIIYKDIIERHNIKNISLIKYLIHYFLANISNLFSINKLFNDLKSQGYRVSKDALFNYVSYLEDAYCFFSVPIFSASLKTRQVNPRKIYAVDHGLATASVWKLSQDYGRLLENIVFIHLRRVSPWRGIYYYMTGKNKEVDFVVSDKNKVTGLIQVSYSLGSKTSREREIEALSQAMDELKAKQGLILTYSGEETINLGKKKIIVKPVWEWALEKRGA